MRVIAGLLICAALAFAQDWKTATDLPGVSWEGLSPDQKLAALIQSLRENNQRGSKLGNPPTLQPGRMQHEGGAVPQRGSALRA